MKAIVLLLFLMGFSKADTIPTLRFDKEITWKQIFDFGFRPKYFDENQRTTCVCMGQVFWLQFENRAPKLLLEKGRIRFDLPIGDEIHMLWHQSEIPVTMEEGKRRADLFRDMFDGYITQQITMPVVIDPSGDVDASNDENDIKARIGKYLIIYGFDRSGIGKAPLIPHFYIGLMYPGKPDYMIKPMDYKIKPPAGYEWYSLDPKVDTHDPAGSPIIKATATTEAFQVPATKPASTRQERRIQPAAVQQPASKETLWPWLVGLLGVIAAIIVFLKRRSKRSM